MADRPSPGAPWPPGPGEFPFSLGPAELKQRASREIASATAELGDLAARAGRPTVADFLVPLDRLLTRLRDLGSHGNLLFAVSPDPEVRAAGREITEATERFRNEFCLNGAIYAGLGQLDLGGEDPETRFAVMKMLREMRRAGVEAGPESRARLLELLDRIDRTANQFTENLARLDRSLTLSGADALSGLPADYRAAHAPGPDGAIRISTKYPDVFPVLAYCDRANVRRDLLYEFMNRAYPENLPVLRELLERRAELAHLLGYPDYAAYALEDKMIGSPAAAHAFLERLRHVLAEPAARDLARYLARKRRDHPEATELDPWDYELSAGGYYDGRIRAEEYGVDARALRAYLPYGRVRDGLLDLCERLFGVTFARVASAGAWHPTVEVYDVTRGTRPLGRCFLDLIPREGKYTHAACFEVREGIAGVEYPQSALICNFLDPRVPPDEARMEWRDVITFFHEFGHLLHDLLSGQPRWLFNAQLHVEWDFIEAPSQLFEEWARDPATLARFARNPDTGEGLPADLLERLCAAEAMGRPVRFLRQVALAAVSLEYYERDLRGIDLTAAYRSAWDRCYLRPLPGDYHPEASFGHLTGYSAFYYTYLWSIVIARDLLGPFRAKGSLTDPDTAARYAAEILAPGGSRPAAESIRAYLGRDFDFEAFERWSRDEPAADPKPTAAAANPSIPSRENPDPPAP